MTAEAMPVEWELATLGPDDPDATWTDPLRGRRGQTLPEAATACLPAAHTQCLAEADLPTDLPAPALRLCTPVAEPAGPAAPPAEHTCLGDLVPGAVAPRVARAESPAPPSIEALPDVPTVMEYGEQVIERIGAAVAEPAARRSKDNLPRLGVSSDALPASPWSGVEASPRAGTPALSGGARAAHRGEARPASPAPQVAPRSPRSAPRLAKVPSSPRVAVAEPRPRASASVGAPRSSPARATPTPRPTSRGDTAPSGPSVRGVPASRSQLQAALQAPSAPRVEAHRGASRVRNVPTWAAQATQMEGPGVWMEPDAAPAYDARSRGPTIVPPQRHVPTTIAPAHSQVSMTTPVQKKSLLDEVVPFALVLVAISLATAALVGAYL